MREGDQLFSLISLKTIVDFSTYDEYHSSFSFVKIKKKLSQDV